MSTVDFDSNKQKISNNRVPVLLVLACLLVTIIVLTFPVIVTQAAPILSITPITWNIVGLDDADVNVGPNQYPVGARVCNTGDESASNLEVSFTWTAVNPFINLLGSENKSIASLPAQDCEDFYFDIVVSRNTQAINSRRQYQISASAVGVADVSTPSPREIFVKDLDQVTNSNLGTINGPSSVTVGQTVQYTVQHNTIPDYQQLVSGINGFSSVFRVISIAVEYGVPQNGSNDTTYADACGWENDPNSSNYLQCVGPFPDEFPNGVAGGSLDITYTLEVISAGTASLSNSIYGYSNGIYNYQVNPSGSPLIVNAVDQSTETPTPTLTGTATITPTLTITGTPPTATATATPTITGTPPTSTPTVTGTPPTPTATGTITPQMSIIKSVSSTTVRPGQSLSFTIKVSNTGTAPATEVVVSDTFQSVLNISSVQTTKGSYTVNSSTRTMTINIGTLFPNELVTITVVTKVNTSSSSTSTYTNFARLTYKFGSTTSTINSNTVSYKVEVTPTLPGTGLSNIGPDDPGPSSNMFWIIIYASVILALVGIVALIYGSRNRQDNHQWAGWFVKTGVLLILSAVLFGVLAFTLSTRFGGGGLLTAFNDALSSPDDQISDWRPTQEGPFILVSTPTELATLPNFPIPTPNLEEIKNSGEPTPDISPIERIVIPSIEVDTVVKYVPYSGLSWLISGLKQEVAWMGDTSWPGIGGNTGLAGHITLNDGTNGPFRSLLDLQAGDKISLYTEENIYTYQVVGQRVVEDNDFSVLASSEYPQLTLITCIEWDSDLNLYIKRIVVNSDLIDVTPIFNDVQTN